MEYRVLNAPSPLSINRQQQVIASGEIALPCIDPREAGKARLMLPANFFEGDILEITAWDRHNETICTWTWPIHYAAGYTQLQLQRNSREGRATVTREGDAVSLSAADVTVTFHAADGLITEVRNSNGILSLNNGPVPVGMKARIREVKHRQEGGNAVFTAYYLGAVDSIR